MAGTSEALLKLPSLAQLNGERVLVARGEEGRELTRKTLEARGGRVTIMPLYRRFCPDYTAIEVDRALDQFAPEAIIALSRRNPKQSHSHYVRIAAIIYTN